MARRKYADSPTDPTTTLAADIDIGDGTVLLTSDPGTEMPTTGPFSFTVGASPNTKPFNAASRSGTTITLVGTAATAHAAGDPVNTEATERDATNWAQQDGENTFTQAQTFSGGIVADSVTSADSTASIVAGFDSIILIAGSSIAILDGANNFFNLQAMLVANGFALNTVEFPLTDDYNFAINGSECVRILVDADTTGHTIFMTAQQSAFGEVIFENVGSNAFDIDGSSDMLIGSTVAGGPLTVAAGNELKLYYRVGTNEWRPTDY